MHAGKKALLAVAMATIVSGSAFAADQGSGKIKFKGVVIDAPCSIAPDSVDKEVDLGEVTTAVINANKKSTPVAVDINLQNCVLSDPDDETATPITKVEVTFSSTATYASDTSLLSNTYASGAENVGVRLLDNDEAKSPLARQKRWICCLIQTPRRCTLKRAWKCQQVPLPPRARLKLTPTMC